MKATRANGKDCRALRSFDPTTGDPAVTDHPQFTGPDNPAAPADDSSSSPSRRDFLTGSTAALVAATAASVLPVPMVYAGGSSTIKIGLVGCGGRGSGAAEEALKADSGTKLVAIADAFQDRIDDHLSHLKDLAVGSRIDVPKDRQYTGFDAYKRVIDQVDLVLLTTPPHFRPLHLAYAVEKGVNAFVEKPMAVDGPGLRKYLQACKDAQAKNLSLVNGFCWRYDGPRRQTLKRVMDGQIGDIVAVETTYNSQGVWEPRRTREQCSSDMEYQMRNWYYYCWLSGDHITEQAVHGIDTMAWVMNDKPPLRCWGVGGRQSRTDPKYGNIWDHFSVVYEYKGDVRGYHHCRHWVNTPSQLKDYVLGTKGMADVFGNAITGPNKWRYRGQKTYSMYQVEHDEMFAAIRAGKPINNGEEAAGTTLLALMGRTAAYTGEVITPEMILTSKEDLSPPRYEFGALTPAPIPVPGTAKFA
jgi:myo-inositol 2-dehydrogenase / D-chiro-inositol 1-dehydrogenase